MLVKFSMAKLFTSCIEISNILFCGYEFSFMQQIYYLMNEVLHRKGSVLRITADKRQIS